MYNGSSPSSDFDEDVPPGLETTATFAKVTASGGNGPWLPYTGKALFENVIPVDEKQGKVLLGFRKAGFGCGKYNPFSGPIPLGGDIARTARADLKAQSGLDAVDIAKVGKLILVMDQNPIALDVDVFRVTSWKGEASENPEIRPMWFASPTSQTQSGLPAIPFDSMFPQDRYWLPLLTSGKYFIGRADLGAPQAENDVGPIRRYWFATI
ncbi:hypothetical protein FRC03_012257 [Tulasnella sp. 419]|nr:hypothetical protein FRC02_012190 [Tulasnella sp. 418]KAG8966246.1 hypothetical protein FRC03_012257 [Tulasnella sp. 419]